ncbi:putative amidoligase enzyme-domain-containing protein [Chaetomium tenue]|uniref:Amidoligase enzyme-domain-containing protein n=1 Tax=Chaetomium tenue TaxID=1854479 RepID=A0ACB7PDN7_9PEZI|nr:putative amidoligase enzyme-domain-containing protein [Chaetomium globosum]
MSSGRTSEHTGLRFGVEIELVLRSRYQKHTTFTSLASEICQRLKEAQVPSHIGNLLQKTGATETYQEWTIIQDSTLPSNATENKFGVELVSPIFHIQQKHIWISQVQQTWRVLEREFEVHSTNECSTHVHLSPSNGPWSLNEAKGVAKAAIFFERCIDALMPGHRRINPYCMSNRWNPEYNELSIPLVFDDISQADDKLDLGDRMCTCSKDSIHAQNTMREEDFVHPHFRWNFTTLTERTRTIEFRQPPASKNARETMTWIILAVSFAQWASERANTTLDPADTPEIGDLRRYVMAGAHISGVADDMLLGLLDDLFRGTNRLPAPRHDLKTTTEQELELEAQKKRMPLQQYKETFAQL